MPRMAADEFNAREWESDRGEGQAMQFKAANLYNRHAGVHPTPIVASSLIWDGLVRSSAWRACRKPNKAPEARALASSSPISHRCEAQVRRRQPGGCGRWVGTHSPYHAICNAFGSHEVLASR